MDDRMSRRRRASETVPVERQPARYTRLRTVNVGMKARVDVSIVDHPGGRSLSLLPWLPRGRDRPIEPGKPLRISREALPALIATLMEAQAALDGPPERSPSPSGATRHTPTTETITP